MPCDVMKVRGERVGDVILSRASEVFFFFTGSSNWVRFIVSQHRAAVEISVIIK